MRFPRKLCATYPAMFLTPLLVVDAQTQAQVAPRTLAAPRLTQGGQPAQAVGVGFRIVLGIVVIVVDSALVLRSLGIRM